MGLGEIRGKHAHYRFGYEEGRFSIFADTENKKGVSLISTRDPVREAERHLGNFRLKRGMLAVVAGVSHLPLLELLFEQLKDENAKGGWILAFESDTELYLALKKLRPEIFADVAVIVPENVSILAELVENIDVENFVGYRVFENSSAVALNPSFYAAAIGDFKKKLASRFSDLFTRLEFEERWVNNALDKLPLLSRARPVSALFGLGRGSKALIVSTGPSLRECLDEIRAAQSMYFIACADSAYRVLVRAGITPHLVYSLDSQAHTTKHFALLPRGQSGMYPILVCDAVSNPSVARDWKGELAIAFTAQFVSQAHAEGEHADERKVSPGCDFIETEKLIRGTVGAIPGDIQSGGSVATSIFDLMRLMQFDEIILIGQDLAYTHREIHTPGTHHTDEWLSKTVNRLQPLENINERVIRRRHTKRETSLTGKPIVTDYVLSLYRDWFASAIDQLQNAAVHTTHFTTPKVYNATRDGLAIQAARRLEMLGKPRENAVLKMLEQPQAASALHDAMRARFLAAPKLQIDTDRIKALDAKIAKALNEGQGVESLDFLRYVGRRFAIKAMRAPEKSEALVAKQRVKQRKFLIKMHYKFNRDA